MYLARVYSIWSPPVFRTVVPLYLDEFKVCSWDFPFWCTSARTVLPNCATKTARRSRLFASRLGMFVKASNWPTLVVNKRQFNERQIQNRRRNKQIIVRSNRTVEGNKLMHRSVVVNSWGRKCRTDSIWNARCRDHVRVQVSLSQPTEVFVWYYNVVLL